MKKYLLILMTFWLISCASQSEKQIVVAPPTEEELFLIEILKKENLISNPQTKEEEVKKLLIEVAEMHLEKKNYPKALEKLKILSNMKNSSKVVGLYHNLGKTHYYLKDLEKAKESFTAADSGADKDYKYEERKRYQAKVYMARGDYGPGLAIIGRVSRSKTFEKDLDYYEMVSSGFANIALCKRSLEVLDEGFKKFPKNESLLKIHTKCVEKLSARSQ